MIANCGRDPRTVDIGREWIAADLLLGNLPDAPATSTSTSLDLAGWDARIYSATTTGQPAHHLMRRSRG